MGIKAKFKDIMKKLFPEIRDMSDASLRVLITTFTAGWCEGLTESGMGKKMSCDMLSIKETQAAGFDPADWRFWC